MTCRVHLSGVAFPEAHFEVLLDSLDATGHRRLRDSERGRGRAEAAMVDDRPERVDGPLFHDDPLGARHGC